MAEPRVDLLHLLEDLRDAYPHSLEETILIELAANARGSAATPTSAGTSACDEGICSARATPRIAHIAKMSSRPTPSELLPTASTADATA